MDVSTARRIWRRILLALLFCGVGYGFTLIPGIVMDYTVEQQIAEQEPASAKPASAKPVSSKPAAMPSKQTVQTVPATIPPEPATTEIKPMESAQPAFAGDPAHQAIMQALKTVIDPELGINIVDLGLIRNIADNGSEGLAITIIPTSPLCPYLKQLVAAIKTKVGHLAAQQKVQVTVDMKHRWTPDNLSAAGRRHFFGSKP